MASKYDALTSAVKDVSDALDALPVRIGNAIAAASSDSPADVAQLNQAVTDLGGFKDKINGIAPATATAAAAQ